MSTALAQPAQAPARQNLDDRWQRASERAQLAQLVVTASDGLGTYRVTSASHPGVSYESDGVHCSCLAAAHGDLVCLHRAAVRDYQAARYPRCPICSDTSIEFISVWDWLSGSAITVSQMPCSCQTEPEPPAPAAPSLERELADATAALASIDARLQPFNQELEYGSGRVNAREHDRLLRQHEIAQQRAWDAQDALSDRSGQVAA